MDNVLFEYIRIGSSVKVTAIDTQTDTEVCIIVPAGLNQQQMQMAALKKLQYVLQKQS